MSLHRNQTEGLVEIVEVEGIIVIPRSREVLIKTLPLFISTYAMGCFKLLGSLCSKLESMMARFWWGARETKTREEDTLNKLR